MHTPQYQYKSSAVAVTLIFTILLGIVVLIYAVGQTADPFFRDLPNRLLTDDDLSSIPDKYENIDANIGERWRLGEHNGVTVIAEHPCSDLCPWNTLRIIRYNVPSGRICDLIGGLSLELPVPVSVGVENEIFCVPKPLAVAQCRKEAIEWDRWEREKMHNSFPRPICSVEAIRRRRHIY
jgi:hypothetical protein